MPILTTEQIEGVLDECVRPVLKMDGGNVRLESVNDDGTVFISFTGRCAGCPGAEYTLETLVSPCLKKALTGVKKVIIKPWHLPFQTP